MEIKLEDWIKNIDKEINLDDGLPMLKRVLKSIKEQVKEQIKERGYAYDMFGDKIVK